MLSATVNSEGELTGESSQAIVPWWSFTKTIIAFGSLKLVEQGHLELDNFIDNKPYTLRQLLQHRAGISDYGQISDYHEAVSRGDEPWSKQELLSRISFDLDKSFYYSNVGYMLIGELIEQCVGARLSSSLKEIVFDPLELYSAHMAESIEDLDKLELKTPINYDPNWVYHGLALGSVADSALCLHRILNGNYLREDLLREMTIGVPLGYKLPIRKWVEAGYGLGLMIGKIELDDSTESTPAIGHTGGGPGAAGAVYQFPELQSNCTVAVFEASPVESLEASTSLAESMAANIASQY